MDSTGKLTRRREEIIAQLSQLGPMRKGSLNEQYVDAILKDGSKHKRGPYTLYTFKEKDRTVSKRLRSGAQVERYRRQIAAFRSFQDLTRELALIGQRLADVEVRDEQEESKKNSKR